MPIQVSRVTDSQASFVHSQQSRELYCILFEYSHKTHSNVNFELSCTIASTQNSTSAYIVIMASLQGLVYKLLVWQSSCESKLYPLNSESICPAACRCSEHQYAAGM